MLNSTRKGKSTYSGKAGTVKLNKIKKGNLGNTIILRDSGQDRKNQSLKDFPTPTPQEEEELIFSMAGETGGWRS